MGWLLVLLLLLVVDIGVGWPGPQPPTPEAPLDAPAPAPGDVLEDADKDTLVNLARDIRQALGLRGQPLDMAKANISQSEWSRMTALYLEKVAARQDAALADGVDLRQPRRQLYTFHNAPGGRARRAAPNKTPRTLLRMELPGDAEVDEAEVRVFAGRPGPLRVFEVWPGGRRLVAQGNATAPGWTTLDVATAARRALGRPLLLDLRCAHCHDAALNVLAEPAHHGRARRAAKAACGKDGQRCCRHALEVELAQIPDMQFIVQPKAFDAGLCRGRCPPRYRPAHHHSLIQGLLRHREHHEHRDHAGPPKRGPRRGPGVPRPCCAPAKLQPLDVLIVDEDNPEKLKVAEWPEMTVLSCACA